MNSINYISAFIISALGLGGIVTYIGKRIIDKTLDIGAERYKNSLNRNLETHRADLSRQTEEFRANLQRLSLEHQIRYAKLHEERGLSIKKIYSLLLIFKVNLNISRVCFKGQLGQQILKEKMQHVIRDKN